MKKLNLYNFIYTYTIGMLILKLIGVAAISTVLVLTPLILLIVLTVLAGIYFAIVLIHNVNDIKKAKDFLNSIKVDEPTIHFSLFKTLKNMFTKKK